MENSLEITKPKRILDMRAVEERHAEIAKLMEIVKQKRQSLAQRFKDGDVDENDAILRNQSMPGILGQRWSEFMVLSINEKVEAFNFEKFNGMAWQSLLQCFPYLLSKTQL